MSSKKDFAAAAFLSAANPAGRQEPQKAKERPAAETRSRRLQLLLKPSDYEKLRRMADEQQCSVNHMIEILIENDYNQNHPLNGWFAKAL